MQASESCSSVSVSDLKDSSRRAIYSCPSALLFGVKEGSARTRFVSSRLPTDVGRWLVAISYLSADNRHFKLRQGSS